MADESDNLTYYFAYGSNLNPDRMNNRKALFSKRSLGKLNNYEFVFNKKRLNGTAAANICTKTGSSVYGALYWCTPDTLNVLDYFEGVHRGHYERKHVDVALEDGSSVSAITYIALPESCDNNLSSINKDYLQHILCGRDILPEDYYSFLESFSSRTVEDGANEEIKVVEAKNI